MFALQNKVRGLKIGVEVIDILFVQWGAVIYFQIYSVVSQSLEKKSVFITD